MAGDSFVSLSGVFLYCRRALRKASLSRVPVGPVFPASRRFMDFTATSARQLLWAKATDESLWWIPQSRRKLEVAEAVNSGPPSEASSSGMPKVVKVNLREAMMPEDPPEALMTVGQLEYLSTMTK